MRQLPFGGQVQAQRCSLVLRHPGHQRGDGGFGASASPATHT